MNSSKQLAKIVLFPLCDANGILMETLRSPSDEPGTRTDALMLAWRLALPPNINVAQAANAVLLAAMNIPRQQVWSDRQLSIIQDLMVLAGREMTEAAPLADTKQSKEWWKLVGPGPMDSKARQRKTRKERVSREP